LTDTTYPNANTIGAISADIITEAIMPLIANDLPACLFLIIFIKEIIEIIKPAGGIIKASKNPKIASLLFLNSS
jgi:hypothetical protein